MVNSNVTDCNSNVCTYTENYKIMKKEMKVEKCCDCNCCNSIGSFNFYHNLVEKIRVYKPRLLKVRISKF